MKYQAIYAAPFAKLGIRCTEEAVQGIEFLPLSARAMQPRGELAQKVCMQLEAYLADSDFRFDLPLDLGGTEHQCKVWRAMLTIPRGETRTYGQLATLFGSSPRAVGQACGNNPAPIIVPCHRVVGKAGLGGFMHHAEGDALDIKRWLLAHERR